MGLNNLRTKVDDLYVGKLKTALVDLKEANKEVVKKTVYNKLNIEVNDSKEKNSDATTLIQINQQNTNKESFEGKKDVNEGYLKLATITVLSTKIGEVENKVPDHAKYITTHEFNEFEGSILDPKLEKTNLETNNDVNVVSKRANNNKEKSENCKRLIGVILLV